MQYMIAFMESPEAFDRRSPDDNSGPDMAAWFAYIGAIRASGIVTGGAGLLPPSTGAVVTVRDGGRQVVDGPYPDSKEQLGGFFIVEVPDLETALDWAARSPAASDGSVIVRPLTPPMP
jgi:hypothetical protein